MKHPKTYAIVRAMIERGNRPGLIREWLGVVEHWAGNNPGPDATALRSWLGIVQPRPFYTARELALLWPAILFAHKLETRVRAAPHPDVLARELEICGLPKLLNLDTGTDKFKDRFAGEQSYFIVEAIGKYRGRGITQAEFERIVYGNHD